MLNSGPKDCRFGCLGLGTCKEYCKFDAISVIDGVAIIDEEKCVMCGKCIEVCPKSIIHIKPANLLQKHSLQPSLGSPSRGDCLSPSCNFHVFIIDIR